MLCPSCRVHTEPGFPYCLRCGKAQRGAGIAGLPAAELHPVDAPAMTFRLGKRCVSVGRNDDNDLVVEDGTVSRYHARIWREVDGYRVEDLDSLNGTWVGGELLRGSTRVLNDGEMLRFGATELRFEQPRVAAVGGRTVIGSELPTHIGGGVAGLREGSAPVAFPSAPLERRPRRRSGWALKRVAGGTGDARYVLRNTSSGKYVQITERDRFLWDRMDGEHTVRDLLFAYAEEYGVVALTRIQQLLSQLNAAELVSGVTPPRSGAPLSMGRRVRGALVRAMLRLEFSISGFDNFLGRLYRRFGWIFFTGVGLTAIFSLVVVGIGAFAEARKHQALFDVAGAGVLGVIAALAGYIVALTVHEMAHALAVKSYGRRVNRGGVMMMMGMPYCFVDTTDMWFEKRGPRIVVSLAGPVATAALAGAFSLGAQFLPGHVVPGIFFQVAFGLYMNTLFNFNPLIPLDGYYVLIDLIGQPRLREQAGAYFRKGLWRDLAHGRLPRAPQWGLALYGLVSLLGTIGFLFLGLFMWQTRLSGVVHDHVPAPLDQVVVAAGIAFLFFPVWYGPMLRIQRRLQRLHPEQHHVELEGATA